MKRYSVGNCEMIESKHGRYVEVNTLLNWLDELTDDDSTAAIFRKIKELQEMLGDL